MTLPHSQKDPLCGFLAGLWICHQFQVRRAGCRNVGMSGFLSLAFKVPSIAGKKTLKRGTEGGMCSKDLEGPEPCPNPTL